MEIIYKKVSELIPYARNNKIHSERQIKLIAASIQEFGFRNWVFCKENNDYVVSDTGEVFSVCHRQKSKTGKEIERYRTKKLKGSVDKDGYKTIRMVVEGKKRHMKLHRLILNNFVENIDNLPTVNHIDGDKHNNNLNNLEWSSFSEQIKHSFRIGLRKTTEIQREAARKNIKKARESKIGKQAYNRISEAKENTIKIKYKLGKSINAISKEEKLDWGTIKRALQRQGVINA